MKKNKINNFVVGKLYYGLNMLDQYIYSLDCLGCGMGVTIDCLCPKHIKCGMCCDDKECYL